MSNSQARFSFVRLLTCGGIAFLLLALFLSSSAQAEMIYAVRVNAIDGAGDNSYYTNYQFSYSSGQWCTQANNTPYNGTTPVMLCDLGSVQTINSIKLDKYSAAGNNVKAMKIDFYDTPALSGNPVYSQTFTNISQSGDTLTLTTPTNARFVKFTMTQNYGGDRYGVGNISFDVSSVVTPTSGTCTVANLSGYNVSNLFDKNAGSTWCSSAADTTNGYYNGTNPNPVFTFELGGTKTLTGITVQPYNVTGNSIKNFNLEFLDANGATIIVEDASQYSFKMWDSTNGVYNYFSFPEVDGVKQVIMTVTSNFRGVGGGGDRIGFAEVYFNTIDTAVATTPEMYNQPMHADNIVRPTSASFVTTSASQGSARSLNYLFDGSGTGMGDVWYTKGSGDDYLNLGYSSVIDFNLPSERMYDSFSIGGYGSVGNQMTDFILELFDSSGKLVFADEFKTDQSINANQYATFSLGDDYWFTKARMTILDNAFRWYGDSGGDRVGFAEIFFTGEPYYFANSPEISAANWTINGGDRKGVLFTDGDEQTATFANPITLNADGVIDVSEGKTLQFSGGVSGNNELKKIGEGTLKIDSAGGSVDIKRLLVSAGRVDMKTYYKGTLEIGAPIDDVTFTKATFSPGNSVGTLTVEGAYYLNPMSTLLIEIGKDVDGKVIADQLIVIGDATFAPGSIIYLDMDEDSSPLGGETFTGVIISSNNISEIYDNVKAAVRSYYFKDIEVTLSENGIMLSATVDPNAVPEPSTWALMALGVVVLFLRKRVRN